MSNRTNALGTVSASLAALSTAVAVHAGSLPVLSVYIDQSAPEGGNGESWETAYNDLQIALLVTNRPYYAWYKTEFRIAGGKYRPDFETRNPMMSFYLQPGDSLVGGFAGRGAADPNENSSERFPTILSGDLLGNDTTDFLNHEDNTRTLIDIDVITTSAISLDLLLVSFRNLTLESSGSLYQPLISGDAPIAMTGCTVRNNRFFKLQDRGYSRSHSFVSTQIVDNMANDSLAMSVGNITRCRIQGNRRTSGHGSPMLSEQPRTGCVVSGSIITDNRGFYDVLNASYIDRCTIAGNTCVRSVLSGTKRISNSIITENSLSSGSWFVQAKCTNGLFVGPNLIDWDTNTIYWEYDSNNRGCTVGTTPLRGTSVFVSRNGQDNNPETWPDNDYQPRSDSLAIDRAELGDQSLPKYGSLDIFGHAASDIESVPNLGSGNVQYADIGALEYVPSNIALACPVDFNNSGAVNTQDIFDYVTAWFSGCP